MKSFNVALCLFFAFCAIASVLAAPQCSDLMTSQVGAGTWTAERMAKAIPRDITIQGAPNQFAGPLASCTANYKTNTTASAYKVAPFKKVGKVFFSLDGGDYVCSASIIDEELGLVWTAGHCTYTTTGNTFASEFMFAPGYISNTFPNGAYYATKLCTTPSWYRSEDLSYDYSVAIVGDALNGLGHFDMAFSVSVPSTDYMSYGYPQGAPFTGQYEHTCSSGYCSRDNSFSPPTVSINCDSTGGCSGGPWLNEDGEVVSLNSYSYNNQNDRMYGPYLDGTAKTFVTDVTRIAAADAQAALTAQ